MLLILFPSIITDMKWHNYKEHWTYFVRPDGYVELISPTIHNAEVDSFADKKQVYLEFKELINEIKINGYKGWIVDTKITLPNVMRIFQKTGARPYQMDGNDRIFFVMQLKEA